MVFSWRSPCLELLIPPLAFQTSYLYMQPILIVCATLTHLPHMARSWLGPSPGLCMPIHNLGPAPFPQHWPSANAIHWCSPLLTNVVTQLLMFLNHMDLLNSYPFTVEQIIWWNCDLDVTIHWQKSHPLLRWTLLYPEAVVVLSCCHQFPPLPIKDGQQWLAIMITMASSHH